MGMRVIELTLRVRLTPVRKRRRLTDVSHRPSSRIEEKNDVKRVAGCRVIVVSLMKNINRCVVDDVLFLGVIVKKRKRKIRNKRLEEFGFFSLLSKYRAVTKRKECVDKRISKNIILVFVC